VSKRGERRDIFSCLNAYDVLFMFLEEERHRKGDGGWLVLRVLPVKRPSFDGLILKRTNTRLKDNRHFKRYMDESDHQ
jgi:hypothetical protein